MLWIIAAVLIVFWFVGIISGYTFYGFLHLLLVLAIATILIKLITERKPI